jgi:hypothetical protein
MEAVEKSLCQIKILLGEAYYNQGYFNIRQKFSNIFAKNKSLISIQLGDNSEIIEGYINRTANPNKTPRIMIGIKYTNWIQTNYLKGDILTIEVFTNRKIKLHPKNK